LVVEGGFYWLRRATAPVAASDIIATALPAALAKFSWPKSMRWGQSGDFTWVRPLRRIVSLLDGAVVPFTLGPITASNVTEGHRVHAPGAFTVSSAADWAEKLRAHYVIVDQTERRHLVADGLAKAAAAHNLTVAPDDALLEEVTGLAEWPVPLIGTIDANFMDLPPEVRELSMKVNQKYFALRDSDGKPAPYFAFIANLEAADQGAAIIAGNERVLRARLSDARHFWDQDLKTPLETLLPKLEKITFHAKIGTQSQRASRISDLAEFIAQRLAETDLPAHAQARTAGLWCKADLVTGMVGEFPELQGIMGGYYAARINHPDAAIIGAAIKTHYQPKGPSDSVPDDVVAISVALADKIDSLIGFFGIGEEATGSRDPFALRRTALGIIRLILENDLTLHLIPVFQQSIELYREQSYIFEREFALIFKAQPFIVDRLKVQLKEQGARHDLIAAVFAASQDDDINFLVEKTSALAAFLQLEAGKDLLALYRRAANIIPHDSEFGAAPDPKFFVDNAEHILFDKVKEIERNLPNWFGGTPQLDLAMAALAALRISVDDFFANVTVVSTDKNLTRNRLRLLSLLRGTIHQIADFSKIAA
jgi:glycyl-tRNA synthetase beta chain